MASQSTSSNTALTFQSFNNSNLVNENGSNNENSSSDNTNASVSVSTALVTKKKHQCTECNRSFDLPSALKQHAATHSNERPHVCERLCADGSACKKRYKRTSDLNTHIR